MRMYKVNLGYYCSDNRHFGSDSPKNMSYAALEFLFRCLDPLRSKEWLSKVGMISGRGGYVFIAANNTCNNGSMLYKVIRVERSI